jgi:hypothetical protein
MKLESGERIVDVAKLAEDDIVAARSAATIADLSSGTPEEPHDLEGPEEPDDALKEALSRATEDADDGEES